MTEAADSVFVNRIVPLSGADAHVVHQHRLRKVVGALGFPGKTEHASKEKRRSVDLRLSYTVEPVAEMR